MNEQVWKHGGEGCSWWTCYLAKGDFPLYITERESKWYVKISNMAMIGPFDTMKEAQERAYQNARIIATQVLGELT